MTRTFVAIVPPESLRRTVARRLAPLAHDASVRWVAHEHMHVTLRFFGGVAGEALERIQEVTLQVCELVAPFDAQLGAAGTFPPKGRPRVFWVGLSRGAERMTALARMLDRAYEEAGLGPPDRPMRPHLTVGRARPMRRRSQAAGERRSDFRSLTFEGAAFTVQSVRVVASELSPRGPAHTPLAEFLLSGDG